MQAKPTTRTWRYTEINHYDKIYELFAKDRATGDGAAKCKGKDKTAGKGERNKPLCGFRALR